VTGARAILVPMAAAHTLDDDALRRVLAKIANCEEITEEEAALARAHQPVLTVQELHEDSDVPWEEERAYLLGECAEVRAHPRSAMSRS